VAEMPRTGEMSRNAGESFLINALFSTKCALAVSPVAEMKGADKVYEDDNPKARVFDVFGMNETKMYASTKSF
jgi:hypothetical protein